MTRRLYHPLWTHLPAIALIVILVVATLQALPMPARAPVHFDASGRPNGWGSPLLVSIFVIGLSVFYLAISALGDEMWARHEERKRFNWLSLIDEAIIGLLSGIQIGYLHALRVNGAASFPLPWALVTAEVVLPVAAAAVLEAFRRHVPHPHRAIAEDTHLLEQTIAGRVQSGQPAIYWESQDPWWMNVVMLITAAALVAGALSTWSQSPALAAFMLIIAAAQPALCGGLRVLVTREAVTVRFGLFGLRLLRLRLTDISDIAVKEFSPLGDFGGWGIRYGRGGVWAYFLSGNVGVQLTTTKGKKYLLGSNHPERLAAAIRAFRDRAPVA